MYLTLESATPCDRKKQNSFLITRLGKPQRTTATHSFGEAYFDNLLCVAYIMTVNLEIPKNYLDLFLSASRKTQKRKSFS